MARKDNCRKKRRIDTRTLRNILKRTNDELTACYQPWKLKTYLATEKQ